MAASSERNGIFAQLGAPQPPPPWSLGEGLLGLVALALGTLLIAPSVALLLSPDPNTVNPENAPLLVGWLLGLVIVTGFVLLRWRRTQEKFAGLALGRGRNLLLLLFFGAGVALVADLVAAGGSGEFTAVAPVLDLPRGTAQNLVLAALFLVLVQPVTESLLFYGVLLPRFRASLGAWPGYALVALLYAGYYLLVYGARLPQGMLPWYGFAFPLVLSMALGAVRIITKSTRSALASAIGAGGAMLVVWLAVVG